MPCLGIAVAANISSHRDAASLTDFFADAYSSIDWRDGAGLAIWSVIGFDGTACQLFFDRYAFR